METIRDRIRNFAKTQDLSVRQFERRASLSNGFVGSMTGGITTEKLLQISNAFPTLNVEWLLTGEGPMLKDAPLVNQTNVNGPNTANVGTQGREVTELEAKLREKDLEIVHLQNQLQDAKEWNLKLFELLKSAQK